MTEKCQKGSQHFLPVRCNLFLLNFFLGLFCSEKNKLLFFGDLFFCAVPCEKPTVACGAAEPDQAVVPGNVRRRAASALLGKEGCRVARKKKGKKKGY